MTLEGTSKLYYNEKSKQFVLTIPSRVACDSQFPFRVGEKVNVRIDPLSFKRHSRLIIEKLKEASK